MDQRERANRAAATSSRQSSEAPTGPSSPLRPMPGTGVTLSGIASTDPADPPAYEDIGDSD